MSQANAAPVPFDQLTPPMQAAERWVGAMAAAGKASRPRPEALEGLPWTWEELGEAVATYRDQDSHERSDEAIRLLDGWLELASSEDSALALVRSRVAWCFSTTEVDDTWGSMVLLWPIDAPGLEIEAIQMPDEGMWSASEGVWALNFEDADEEEMMGLVYDELTEMCFVFDPAKQQDPSDLPYGYAVEEPAEIWALALERIQALSAFSGQQAPAPRPAR